MNLPNKLTILRVILIPIFLAVYVIPAIPYRFAISLAIFIIASITDLLDGYIARKYNLITDFGKFLDPIADKILVASAYVIMIICPPCEKQIMLPWYTSLGVIVILAREFIVSAFRMIAASKGKVLAAIWSGKFKTTSQDITVVFLLVVFELINQLGMTPLVNVLFIIGNVFFWISVLLTVISGLECLLKNKDVLSSK
ncbi:MAG: CDP-diacylglycerol--glycerol-3-phosphate 3-phosphatidyltransferase [Clostridia bacterium]|nr:CDP-diacylglycerol--glycerol-3-phosphate 3-phosphatidyltransferase [Clostridia bacterium]